MPDALAQLPLRDPQFWVVTAAAAVAAGWMAWRLIPKRLLRKKRGVTTRTTLTVGGKPVKNKPDCH